MKALRILISLVVLCTATSAFAEPGAASFKRADKEEKQGSLDAAAQTFEQAARESSGKRSAEAWLRAGRNWLYPDNPKQSFSRAMSCFQRVDQAAADPAVARETKAWMAVLSRLTSAEEAAHQADHEADRLKSALEDAAEGSRALHPAPSH